MKQFFFNLRLFRPIPGLYPRKYKLVGICILFIILQHCQPRTAREETVDFQEDEPETFIPLEVSHAKGFNLLYHAHYKELQLIQEQDTTRYLLLPKDTPPPQAMPFDQTITIPVRKIITQSTTHLGQLAFLNAENVIVGIDEADYVFHETIRQKIREGSITEVGSGENLNTEQVLALSPDLLIVSGMPGTTLDRFQPLIEAGISVIVNTEWMESSLLAKAEWVKLMAALTNREALAEEKFSQVKAQYDSIATLATLVKDKPKIIIGSPFQDVWHVPGGKSERSQLFQTAAATWPWAQDSSAVSIMVSFETMYAYGLQADYWLNPGQVSTRQELLAKDARFADFKAFQQDQIYNHNKRMNSTGLGNDFFESGTVHPERVLADVVKILHPEVLPDDTLYYYQKIN